MIKPWMIHRLFRIINFFLAGGCLIILAGIGKLLLTQNSIQTVQSQALVTLPSAENVQKLEEKNYSFPKNFITEDSQIVEDDIDTGIELKGMLSSPDHNYAIVQFKGEQKLVKSGDGIGVWKIREINEDGLTVEGDGKTVILKQSRQMPGNIVKPSVVEKETPAVDSHDEISSENKITVDAQVFRKLMTHWADLFREVQMMPYVEKGKSKGYVLCYLQPDGLMQKLGFRTGDIIEKINDREVTNLESLMALYDFAEKGNCRIEVKRGPKKIQMVYQIAKNPV